MLKIQLIRSMHTDLKEYMGQLTSVLLGYTDNTQTANWLVARVLSILNTSILNVYELLH